MAQSQSLSPDTALGPPKGGRCRRKNPKPKPRRGYLPHEVTERSKGLSFKLERMKSRQKKKRELMLVRMLGSWTYITSCCGDCLLGQTGWGWRQPA